MDATWNRSWKFFCHHEMQRRISRRKTKTMGETEKSTCYWKSSRKLGGRVLGQLLEVFLPSRNARTHLTEENKNNWRITFINMVEEAKKEAFQVA